MQLACEILAIMWNRACLQVEGGVAGTAAAAAWEDCWQVFAEVMEEKGLCASRCEGSIQVSMCIASCAHY